MLSRKGVAKSFDAPYSTVCDIFRNDRKNGNEPNCRGGGGKKMLSEEDIGVLGRAIGENCASTLHELRDLLKRERGKSVCLDTIRTAIKGFRYSIKGVKFEIEAPDTPENWERRRDFAAWFAQSRYEEGKVVFLNETGFRMAMRRFRTRSLKDKAHLRVPWIKSRNISTMAAVLYGKIVHYKVLTGNKDKEQFALFLQELFSVLPEPGCTLVLEDSVFHRAHAVENLVHQSGHSLKFLPPATAFFNPTEFFFAQWKTFVAAAEVKNEEGLIAAINSVEERVTPEQLRGYFARAHENCAQCLQGNSMFTSHGADIAAVHGNGQTNVYRTQT